MDETAIDLIVREFAAGGERRELVVRAAEHSGGESGPFAAAARLAAVDRLAVAAAAPHRLTVTWSVRSVVRAGAFFAPSEIRMSAPLAARWPLAESADTVAHEIAHAMTRGHGHDYAWRVACAVTGARPEACYPAGLPRVPGKWQGTCPSGHVSHRVRRPRKETTCRTCRPYYGPVEWVRVP